MKNATSGIDPTISAYCDAQREAHVDELKRWIAEPSISADPAHVADVRRCCVRLVERMREIGLEGSVLETDGNPLAFGEWLGAPGAPTILIYGHYDVQPVDPLELWDSPPFEGTVRDGKMYGRGAVDDKGQVLMHLAAIEAHMKTRGRLPINVKIVVEGEEEIGSPNFESADLHDIAIAFVPMPPLLATRPFIPKMCASLTTSMRGLVHWEITVDGPSGDVHSGYYGGIIRNPIEALAQIIAGLKDADGRVTVPGFYDGVNEPDATQAAELRSLPFDEAQEARALGVPELAGERGRLPLERMWYRPTLECNGIYRWLPRTGLQNDHSRVGRRPSCRRA